MMETCLYHSSSKLKSSMKNLAFSLKEQSEFTELAEEFGMCFNLSILLLILYYMGHPARTQITLDNVT